MKNQNRCRCFHMPVWLRCVIATVLILVLVLGIFGIVQHIRDHQVLDVTYTEHRSGSFTNFSATKPENLVKYSDVIYEGIVIDISFIAEREAYLPYYYLDTVYTVAVIRTYKGSTDFIETIHVSDGLRDYKLQEQLDALREAGAPESYRDINVHNGGIQPKIGSTYLFCVRDPDHLQGRWASSYSQFALSGNLAVPSYDKYNPDVIKEYLPYVPHPLLIGAAIGGAVLATVLLICISIKKRKPR